MTNKVASSAEVEGENGTVPQVQKNREIKFPVDFSVFKRTNVGVKQRLMQENPPVADTSTESLLTLSQLVTQIRETAAQIESMLAQNPELATVRAVDFHPASTVLQSVRDAVWGIFNATGKFIGRNSAEAVIADTAHLFSTCPALFNVDAAETTKGSRDSNIGTWIKDYVSPQLDSDMKEYVVPKSNKHISAIKPYLRLSDNLYKRVRAYSN